jgi:polysaccharide export outer membrane protein
MRRLYSKLSSLVALLLLTSLVAACAHNHSGNVKANSEPYRLGTGDTLRINVFEQENLSGEFAVDEKGELSLPLIERLPVAGLTVTEVEKQMKDRLYPNYLQDPRISVEVIKYRDIYVLGEVRRPGNYPYVHNMSVLQAVATAGGYTYRADEGTVDVIRKEGDEVKTMQLNSGSLIHPSDTVIVTRRLF